MKLEGKTVFPIGAFCAPQPPITKDGKEYPNKITEEQYRLLAESGVNLVYAHNEVMGTETENYAFDALDLAEKVGVKYLVRDSISKEYAATAGDMDKWFKTLTEEEFKYANVYDEDNEINVKDLIKLAQMMTQNK